MKNYLFILVSLLSFLFLKEVQAVPACPSLAEFASQNVSIKGDLDTQINFTSQEFPFMKGPKRPVQALDDYKSRCLAK